MKKMDVFIVRFLPFILYIIFNINVICVWNGIEEITIGYNLHGNSAIYALGLFLISLANKRYHCVWNRAMYAFLIVAPCINFIDACFDIVDDVEMYFYAMWSVDIIVALTTAFLAVRHFVIITKRKHDKQYGREQQTINNRKLRHRPLQKNNTRRKRRKLHRRRNE